MIIKFTYKLTALFLTFVLLANNINNVIIVTDFVINQDFIAKTLCIQKEEQKGCNGKCQLRKELTENNTDSNSESPLPTNNRTCLDVFVVNASQLHNHQSSIYATTQNQNIDVRLLQPIFQFYDIDTPPPNLS